MEARDMRRPRSHWQRSKCAFQRARRLLFCPCAIGGFDGTGTPSSSAEWQRIEKPPPLKVQTATCKRAACGLAVPPYHRAEPINLPSNQTVATRGRLSAFFETLARPSTLRASRLCTPRGYMFRAGDRQDYNDNACSCRDALPK